VRCTRGIHLKKAKVKMNGKTGAAIKLDLHPNCGGLRSHSVIDLPIQLGMVIPQGKDSAK